MDAKEYITAHWKGQLGTVKSFFFNLVLPYLIVALVPVFFHLPTWYIILPAVVLFWGIFGCVRSALINMKKNTNSAIYRIFCFIIFLLVLAFLITALSDLFFLGVL